MTQTPLDEAENFVADAAENLTVPYANECLPCYINRMLEHGCNGLRWAVRYRDLRAPQGTRLEVEMENRGGYCDCEVLANVVECTLYDDPDYSEHTPLPECRGVVQESLTPCSLWRWS